MVAISVILHDMRFFLCAASDGRRRLVREGQQVLPEICQRRIWLVAEDEKESKGILAAIFAYMRTYDAIHTGFCI